MKSKTSLFSPTLFRKNLTRFAPLWAIFLALMVLNGPVNILSARTFLAPPDDRSRILTDYYSFQRGFIVTAVFYYGPLCAGLLFRYLHKTRSAYMMHAFPLNRSTQFVTNTLSGLAFAIVPFVLQLSLNLLASIGLPGQSWLWKLLFVEILSFLFFYGLAVFCMQISGNTIVSVLSYLILNFVFAAIPLLLCMMLETFTFGFEASQLEQTAIYFAPLLQMLGWFSSLGNDGFRRIAFGVYGLIGCILLGFSWLQYRARHLEQAGEAMVFRWSKAGFALLFTVSSTFFFGLILTELFCNTGQPWHKWFVPMLLFFLLASFAGWFGAQMILRRTVRVFHKRQVLGWLCIAALITAMVCGLCFDVLGTQRYVPEASEVQEATVLLGTDNYSSNEDLQAKLTVKDPEVLGLVLQTHRAAYAHFQSSGHSFSEGCTVSYLLKSGRHVVRRISIDSVDALKLSRMLSAPDYAVNYYEAILPQLFLDETHMLSLEQSDGEKYTKRNGIDRDALRKAILQDAREGNLQIPFSINSRSLGWRLWDDDTNIWLGSTAKHTMALFGIEP